jgi:hypothetical protein
MVNELNSWIAAAGEEAGVDPADVPERLVLDLARDVAHGVVRPGAPVTAYLMGLAVGRGADPSDLAGRLSALAQAWRPAAENNASRAASDGPPAGGSRAEPPIP